MGCCGSKDDTIAAGLAYGGPAPPAGEKTPLNRAGSNTAASPKIRRKGSIAGYQENSKVLMKESQKAWETLRRNPVRAESFKPEAASAGRRGSVVCEMKSVTDADFIIQALQNHPLFSHLTRNQLAEVAQVMVQVEYVNGAKIYHSWELGTEFFLIKTGRVQFSQSGDDIAVGETAQAGRKMSINMAGLPGMGGPVAGGESSVPIMGATEDQLASMADGGMELGAGMVFGELATVWSTRRGFTATALDNCEMFTISRDALRRSMAQGFSKARCDMAGNNTKFTGFFAKVKLLVDMWKVSGVEIDLGSLADGMTTTQFKDGDELVRANTPMDRFILITKGEVELKLEGCAETVTLSRGDYVGEACLARGNLQWSGTATAVAATTCEVISRSDFKERFALSLPSTEDADVEVPAVKTLTDVAQREGALLPASNQELPLAMRGRKYSEFQRGKAVSKYAPSELVEPEVAEGPISAAEVLANPKTSDFNFCCQLNGESNRERLVGHSYWAGHEGWRAGVWVYLCTAKATGTPYALRVYDKAALWADAHNAPIEEARLEYMIASKLNHPRLLPVLSLFQDARCLFYVMPFIAGTTVWAEMSQGRTACLRVEQAKHYSVQVLSGLQYLHSKGLVHRNIYPDSMLINKEGWLTLGGTMFIRKPKKTARLYTVCGVPDYLSPEMIQGRGHNRLTDLWSFGVLIHEMVTGRPPFDGEDPLDTMQKILSNAPVFKVGGPCVDLIGKLLQPVASQRLGFSAGTAPAQIEHGISQILMHEWFEDIDVPAVMAGEGETPYQPHAVPMGEIGQQREDPPWSMKSNFLAKNLSMLSADENASFEDW